MRELGKGGFRKEWHEVIFKYYYIQNRNGKLNAAVRNVSGFGVSRWKNDRKSRYLENHK